MQRIIITLILALFPFYAMADQCYQSAEFEAEQIVRFQTQLMVIAMMCEPHTDQQLYSNYQKFSDTNQSIIQNNEQKLLQFFQKNNATNSNKSLHTLRTNIANEMAQYASAQVPSKFCRKFQSRIDEAVNLQPQDLTVLINGMGKGLPSSYPLCMNN